MYGNVFLNNFISTYMSKVMFERNVGYVLKNSPDSKNDLFCFEVKNSIIYLCRVCKY